MPRHLSVDESHVRCLKEAKLPSTPTELRSLPGFVIVYRRFIRTHTDKARPLYDILRGNPKTLFPLGDEEVGFKTLVDALTAPSILSIPKRGLRYSIDTDATCYQVNCSQFRRKATANALPLGFSHER